MSVSCGCMDMWLVFLTLILLTRFSQRGSLVSGGGQLADHVPRGCSRLTSISRRWGWAWHLPGGWPDGGPWSTGGKWTQRRAVLAHAPIPDLYEKSNCSASFVNVKISDLDFSDYAVILAEMLDILMGALQVLNEESE